MSDNTIQSSDLGFEDPDIRNALLAAFGSDALDWFEEHQAGAGPASDFGTASQISELPHGTGVTLDAALQQLSESLTEDNAEQDTRPSHLDRPQLRSNTNAARHVMFAVGNQLFAIPLDGIQEIDRCGKVTALPRTPDWLRGITNLRGRVFSVTDFRKLIQLSDDSPTTGEKIVVVQSKLLETKTALVVDRVLGIRNLECVEGSASMLSGKLATFSKGISSAPEGTIVLIEPDQLLGCSDLRTFSGS